MLQQPIYSSVALFDKHSSNEQHFYSPTRGRIKQKEKHNNSQNINAKLQAQQQETSSEQWSKQNNE